MIKRCHNPRNGAVKRFYLRLIFRCLGAINAKSLKVTFSKGVEDTSKAEFAVNKGSVKVNTSSVTWNEAKTEATIELTGKLTAGEYTVSVTGLTEAALTGKITAENDRVEAVTISSEIAPFTNTTNGSKTVAVGYKVVNQYDEDVTNTTSLVVTAVGASVDTGRTTSYSKGVVTIPVIDAAKENDPIVLTLVHTETGKSASQTIKVGAQSSVAEVAITGLYNKDNKTLTETTDLNKDAFYLLVEGKDQYGNVLKANQITGLIGNNTNTLIAQINGGSTPTIETITVSGKEVTAVKLTGSVKAGSTNVMLIAPTTGKNSSYTINVAEGQRADSVTFEVPELVVAKEELFIPITVTDKEGNVITDVSTLKDAARGVQISGVTGVSNANIGTKDGKIGITIADSNSSLAEAGYISLVAVTSTSNTTTANIQVKAAAEATIVTGLRANNSTTLLPNATLVFSTTNLTVEDQYGRVMTKAALDTWLNGSGNEIIIQDTTAGTVGVTATNSAAQNDAQTVTLSANTHTATVTGKVKGTEKVTVKLKKSTGEISTSAKEISFQVTDGSEYASYQVDPIGSIFDEVGAGLSNDALYDKTLKVYGVLANGTKVELTHTTDYTVDAPAYLDYSSGKLEMDATSATGSQVVPYATGANEVKATVTVTINATGQQFKEEITVSKVKPTVTALKIVPQATSSVANTKSAFDNVKEELEFTSSAFTETAINTLVNFVVYDSYGVAQLLDDGNEGNLGATIKLVATPAVANTITFTKQNAHDTTFEGLEKGEKFTVAATIGGVSKAFTVTGTLDTVAQVASAKTAVEGGTYTTTTQAATATEAAAKTLVEGVIDNVTIGTGTDKLSDIGVSYELVDVVYTAPEAGTAENITGTNGSYKFKVKLTKGNASVTTDEITLTISATPHS